jgi:hypothetical protein
VTPYLNVQSAIRLNKLEHVFALERTLLNGFNRQNIFDRNNTERSAAFALGVRQTASVETEKPGLEILQAKLLATLGPFDHYAEHRTNVVISIIKSK